MQAFPLPASSGSVTGQMSVVEVNGDIHHVRASSGDEAAQLCNAVYRRCGLRAERVA
jgi:hypothetical protein